MATVWILNHYAPPPLEGQSGARRHLHLSRALVAEGHDVVLFASALLHGGGQTQQAGSKSEEPYSDIHEGGLTCRLLRGRPYRSMAGRLIGMAHFEKMALAHSGDLPRPDLVIGSSVHLFAGHAAYLLARRHSVPFVFEIRDIWPRTVLEMGQTSAYNPVYIGLRALEIFLYRRADRIISLLPEGARHIAASYADARKVVHLPNMVSLDAYGDSYKDLPDREEFRVVYLGSMTPVYGLECLIGAARLLQERHPELPIRIRLVGGGAAKDDLVRQAKDSSLRNVEFVGSVPRESVAEELGDADALILLFRKLPIFREFGISMNKLWEYLGSKRPIIFAVDSANNPIDDARAGITCRPENPEAIAEAVLALFRTDREARREMGLRGYEYARAHCSVEVVGERFVRIVDEVLEHGSAHAGPREVAPRHRA